ncbi:putative SET domain containing protein [Leishmania naiffi]|uniref:SET domain containing protein n=1 Tax=Leishmania naiffi TaxID=5678 RepID=A0AAW3B8Z4_9TRYP
MKATTAFGVGDIVLPLSRSFSVCQDQLLLPDGVTVRHGADFNVTIISHFLVAVRPLDADTEIIVNFNLCFYDLLKSGTSPTTSASEGEEMHTLNTMSAHTVERPVVPGFRYLEEESKQELYRLADEQVRQQAIVDGFLPRGSDEGRLTVVHAKPGKPVAVSTNEHEEGDVVFETTGVPLPFPIRSTVELPGDLHLRLTGGSEFLQHSCLPNIRLEIDGTHIRGIALRAIEANEKLTYNYLTTEWEISKVFHCSCNVYCCYGLIKGFRFLDREQQEHLLPHCSPAVCEKYRSPLLSGATFGALTSSTALFTTAEGRLTSQRDLAAGTVLFEVCGTPQLDQNELVLERLRLSHSCDANTILVNNCVVASRPLSVGDAVTSNLNLLYYTFSPALPCACGSASCAGHIDGFKALPIQTKNLWWSLASNAVRAEALENGYKIVSSNALVDVRRTSTIGDATFASRNIAAGTRIFHIHGLVLPFPTVYTIYLGEGKHLLFADGAQCLAHSCDPNTRIVVNTDTGSFDCFALRNIAADELISFNYLTTEWDMSEPFTCACGSSNCYGRIAGFRHVKREGQLSLWSKATRAVQSLFAQTIRQMASTLATLNRALVAPVGANGALLLAEDTPSGTVLFKAPAGFAVEGDQVCFGDIFLAHSCNASAVLLEGRVVLSDASTAGTAVTLNVNQLCYKLAKPFTCRCGGSDCTHVVGGFAALSDTEKARILLCTAPDVRAEATAAGFMIPCLCPLVTVRANGVMGQSTFAARRIPRGTRFFKVNGLVLQFPTVYSIQLERGRHLQFAGGAQCLAHSCSPNVRIMVDAESRSLDCLALRDIEEGELIAFNYLTTEWDLSAPFSCLCGNGSTCFGRIRGLKYLSEEQRQRLWWMLTPAMRHLGEQSFNWKTLAGVQLRTDQDGRVRAAKELKEGLIILEALQVQLRSGWALVGGVRLSHSCMPTAAIVERRVIMIGTVCPETEITLDLNCLAYVLDEPFMCTCAAEATPHAVKGFAALSAAAQATRLILTEPSVRAVALRDGYRVPCSCSLVEVHANGDMGQATFAAVDIAASSCFFQVKGLCIPFPTMYTIMLDEGRHLLFADGAQCLAHSCDPNVRVRVDATNNTLECQALRPIKAGELIAFNYNATEWSMNTPFRCLCGASQCVYEIRGFKHLSQAQRALLQRQATPAIKAMASAYADVQLPVALLRAAPDGRLRSARAVAKGDILLEVMYLDVQPNQICVGRHYVVPHDANWYNCVLVEGRLIASRTLASDEQLLVNMNFFVYDMTEIFPRTFDDACKGFKFIDEAVKQECLYLCEPPVRAQAMRDGWIVKSTQETLVVQPNGDMGQTAYARCDIAAGTTLFHCTGLVIPFPTMYTICVGVHQHLLFGDAAECIAHHCDPNVEVRVDESGEGAFDFVTIRDIARGEMITFNYTTTEWDMNTPFVCLCGSPKCAGTIQGFKHLQEADQQRLWPNASKVVKDQWRAYIASA